MIFQCFNTSIWLIPIIFLVGGKVGFSKVFIIAEGINEEHFNSISISDKKNSILSSNLSTTRCLTPSVTIFNVINSSNTSNTNCSLGILNFNKVTRTAYVNDILSIKDVFLFNVASIFVLSDTR